MMEMVEKMYNILYNDRTCMQMNGNAYGEVRIGDIFAQLVEYYGSMNDHHSAYRTVERMRQRGIAPERLRKRLENASKQPRNA